ncbi:hypothetical protein FHW94_003163 [Novosphingobium sp. SG720]|nr:hypothetical protein [Novosphingobium sp. SG720]
MAKLEKFSCGRAAPATRPQARLLALKFVLHIVCDLHQPLHASDNHDRDGNCVALAKQLSKRITRQEMPAWSTGTPEHWASESFGLAEQVV